MEQGNFSDGVTSNSKPSAAIFSPTTPQSSANQSVVEAVEGDTSTSPPETVSAQVLPAMLSTQPASKAAQEHPLLPTWIPVLLSCVAIVLAITNLIYTFRKDKRSRKQSIQDDYWFRKIASPITIEPLVKNLLTISSELPAPSMLDASAAKALWKEQTKSVEEFRSSIGALSLLSKQLPHKLVQHIDTISDDLAEFYGQYIQDIESGSTNSNCEKTKGALIDSMVRILETIQSHQEKVGYSGWIANLLDKNSR